MAEIPDTSSTIPPRDQDLTVLGLRLLLLAVVLGALFLQSGGTGQPLRANLLPLGGGVLGVNVVLWLLLFVEGVRANLAWPLAILDWVSIGALTWMARGNVGASALLFVGLPLVSFLRLGMVGGLLNVGGALLSFFVVLTVFSGQELSGYIGPMVLPMVLSVTVAASMALVWYSQRNKFAEEHKRIIAAAAKAEAEVEEMKQRTQAITTMSYELSSTMNYQRVLDAAVGMGALALEEEGTRFSSVVMLYRPEDRMLYVVTGMGLARSDRERVTPGRKGVIAETLAETEPIIAGALRKDPELGRFATFQRSQSSAIVPLRAGYESYGVIVFASDQKSAFSPRYQPFLHAIGIQATISLQNTSLYQDLADEKEHLLEVEEEARKKLARDLHDGPTQTISAIAMRMTIIQKLLELQPHEVPGELKKIEDLARKTTSEIRHMMFTLRPLALESQGLQAALEQLAEKMQTVYSQRVNVRVGGDVEMVLTHHQSGTIFYIIEEAVNNARKHAQSDVIRASVLRQGDMVVVEISDDGVGFDVEAVGENYEGRTSLGMVNLHERSELIDGALTIDSAPGKGTRITIVVPLDPAGTNERFQNPQPKRRRKGFQLSAIR